tara:strand:+ start:8 stop:1753 length:1746 start_codon:yes stop_codon:yes gene_type:complete
MAQVFKRIFNEGITDYPYTAYKKYEVTDTNHSSSFEISILRAISPNGTLIEVSQSKHQGIEYDSTILTGSRAVTRELNKIPQKIVWSAVKTSCFDHGHGGHLLHPTASIISIPQNKFGGGIKPGSVTITDNSKAAASASLFLSESKHTPECGIIHDTIIDKTKFVDKKHLQFYLGFQKGIFNKKYKAKLDDGPRSNPIVANNLTIVKGINTTGEVSASGYGAESKNTSYLYSTTNTHNYNFFTQQNDFAVSMWVKLPPSQSYTNNLTNTLIKKRNHKKNPYNVDPRQQQFVTESDSQFPFDISVYNQTAGAKNGQIIFEFNDGRDDRRESQIISSSTKYNDNEWHNVIVHHSTAGAGNNRFSTGEYEMYIDGTKVGVERGTISKFRLQNESDITIMCDKTLDEKNNLTNSGTSGSFDEVRIYSTDLSSDNIFSLSNNHVISGSAYQTRNVGYVYYQKGLIVITDPRPKYQNCFLGNGAGDYTDKGFEFTYKSTKRIKQQSFLCEIGRNQFNVSQNNTLRKGGDDLQNELQDFVTGSDFRPYITSVGLYNDEGDLLAIAKMGSPLKKRQDVDVTIDVRLDYE